LNRFTLKYIENNRTRFESRYLTFNDFKINFEVTDKMLNELIEFANKEDLFKDKEAIEISGEKIKLLIKAYIARDLWSSSEFYEIMNENEVKYQKAIDILDDWKYYETLLMKKI